MKRIWSQLSIKLTMTVLFILISLSSVILMGIISHLNYSHVVKQDFHTVTEEATKRLTHHIEFYLDQLAEMTKALQTEELLQSWLEGDKALSLYDKEAIEARLRRSIAMNHGEITGVFLMSIDKRVLGMRTYNSLDWDYSREPWYAQPFSGQRVLLPTHTITYPSQNGMPVISLITPIYSSTSLLPIGSFVLDVSLEEIIGILESSSLGKTGLFMLSSKENTIVYHPNKQWLGKSLTDTPLSVLQLSGGKAAVEHIQGESMLVSTSTSDISGWRVTGIVPFDEMASGLYLARNSTIIVSVVLALMILVIVPWASNLFIAPVLQLKRHLHRVFLGDFQTRAKVYPGKNELMELNASFNRMVEQLDEQVYRIASLEYQEAHARLRQREAYFVALQNQINPHFLYNSLDIIKSIAYMHDDELIVNMAGNLAEVYRYTAQITDHEVSLKEEVAILEKYLEIIKIKYPKRFQSSISIALEFLSCKIVKLTLQPFVENAVKYVVEPCGGVAKIEVIARRERDDLIIEVSDNGQGIEEEAHRQLVERLHASGLHSSEQAYRRTESLGISNVHLRLILTYGEGYGIAVQSSRAGTTVSIRIPLEPEQQ